MLMCLVALSLISSFAARSRVATSVIVIHMDWRMVYLKRWHHSIRVIVTSSPVYVYNVSLRSIFLVLVVCHSFGRLLI